MILSFLRKTESDDPFERELRGAACAVRESMLRSLDGDAEQGHAFSEPFLGRMRELFQLDARRNRRARALRRAAIFLIGAFLTGVLFLAFHPEARAGISRLLRSVYENSVVYNFAKESGEEESAALPELEFTWLPGESEEQVVFETETCRAVMLTWDGGTCIVECFITAESDQVEIFTEGRQREEVLIRGRPAEAYLGQGEGDSKDLLWMNENRDRMYLMNACLPLETMVRIAEGIREK